MKKRMVNILMVLCTLAFVCSAGSAVYFAKAEETEQPALVMQEGASIRYFDPVGIRFVTEITKEKYTEIKTADENAVFGTLILPYDLLNGQTLTLENYEALKANNIVAEEWLKDAKTTKSFTGVLVGKDNGDGTYANFPEEYYNRDLYAVSYCSYNDKVIYAPNPQTYSVAYIASSLLANGEKEELLYKITDSVLKDGISFKETAKEMTVGETFELNALLNAEGLKAVYTSENPEIACVDENGVITAVANGFVKITATIGNQAASVDITVDDIVAPVMTKKDGKTDQFIAVGTQITLGNSGMGNYLTVTDDSNVFTLTYDKVLKNGIAQTGVSQFTVAKNDVWEVFVTAKDNAGNEQKSYMQFAESSLQDQFISFNDEEWIVVSANAQQFLSPKGGAWNNGYILCYNADYKIVTDDYGKKSVRFTYTDGYHFNVTNVGDSFVQMRVSLRIGGNGDGLADDAVLASLQLKNAPNITWKTDGAYYGNVKLNTRDYYTEILATGMEKTQWGTDYNFADYGNMQAKSMYLEIDRAIFSADFGDSTFVNYVVVNKKDGKTDQFVAENTQVTLGNGGITAQDTTYLSALGNVTYTYDKVLKNGVEQTDKTQFTVAKNDVWEVFVTLNKGTEKETYAYMQFVDSSLQDGFISFNDGVWVFGFTWPGNDAGAGQRTIYKLGEGTKYVNILMVNDDTSTLITDKYGKVTLQANFTSVYEIGLLASMNSVRMSMKLSAQTTVPCVFDGICSTQFGYDGNWYVWKNDGIYNGNNEKIGGTDFFEIYASTLTDRSDGYRSQTFGTGANGILSNFTLEIDHIIYGSGIAVTA